MTVLVVGHTGYVGRNLLQWLDRSGVPTAGLSRGSLTPSQFRGCVVQFSPQDIETDSFLSFLKNTVSGVVVLAADTRKVVAPSEIPSMLAANVTLPTQVGALAARAGVPRMVFASTYSVKVGEAEYSPQSLYAASKKAAEDLLEFVAITTTTAITSLRIYDIYGPGQPHDRLIPYVIRQARQGGIVSMTPGEQEICPIYVEDVCSALAYSLTDEGGKLGFRICSAYGPESIRARDIPGRLARAVGCRTPVVEHDVPRRPREAMLFQPSYDPPAGWTPSIGLDEGLRAVWDGRTGSLS